MISQGALQQLASTHHTDEYPNTVREYCQNLFLSELYKLEDASDLLFKGGTALRILYGSPRFSEDLDFSIVNVESRRQRVFIEHVFMSVLEALERFGIRVELGRKPGVTSQGYFGQASFWLYDYPPIVFSFNISSRIHIYKSGEVDSIVNDFIPSYTVFHLAQQDLVEEKVFGALMGRKKARDFYDLYFIMRKGMLSAEQKTRLVHVKQTIISNAKKIDFKAELSMFLPSDHHLIIKNFQQTLAHEMERQIAV